MKQLGLFNLTLLVLLLVGILSCEEEESDALPYLGHHDLSENGETVYHKVPEWKYLTQDSTWLSSKDLEGQVLIAKFFFANCPTICPPMTTSMKQLNNDLSEYKDDITFLSFSIDPERDTPANLKKYIDNHGITADNWYFLTGDEEATHELGVHGFYVHAASDENAPGGYAHSGNFVLVDENLHIRGVYDGLDKESCDQLIADVNKLLSKE